MRNWLLAQEIQVHAINAEIQGMITENQDRISRDESIAYTDKDFQAKASELYDISNTVISKEKQKQKQFIRPNCPNCSKPLKVCKIITPNHEEYYFTCDCNYLVECWEREDYDETSYLD